MQHNSLNEKQHTFPPVMINAAGATEADSLLVLLVGFFSVCPDGPANHGFYRHRLRLEMRSQRVSGEYRSDRNCTIRHY
jgi:hypothetical protein